MTLLVAGFALAIWLARRDEDRQGRNGDRIVDLGLLMLFCGLAGSRLLSVLADGHLADYVNLCLDPKQVPPFDTAARLAVCSIDADCGADFLCDVARHACYPPRDCFEVFEIWHGGLAYYGGFLLAVPVGLAYARRQGLGMWRIADLVAPMIALGLAFGRIGCFFNGCCYGRVSDAPWAMRFPGHAAAVHPTQLYEAFAALAIFAVLYLVARPRKRGHGQVFAGLLVLYGVARFVLEFWRDDERGALLGVSTSQWMSVPLVLFGIVLFLRKGKRWQDG
jgi:phosphatidylglycerol:prolipoprotein diacylglycerol transferase